MTHCCWLVQKNVLCIVKYTALTFGFRRQQRHDWFDYHLAKCENDGRIRIQMQLLNNCNALSNLFYEFDITLHTSRLLNLWHDQNGVNYSLSWHMSYDNGPLLMGRKGIQLKIRLFHENFCVDFLPRSTLFCDWAFTVNFPWNQGIFQSDFPQG